MFKPDDIVHLNDFDHEYFGDCRYLASILGITLETDLVISRVRNSFGSFYLDFKAPYTRFSGMHYERFHLKH